MTEPAKSVLTILPEWPAVRCDSCGRVYTIPPEQRSGLIIGCCKHCGHERFSTFMRGVDTATFNFPHEGGA